MTILRHPAMRLAQCEHAGERREARGAVIGMSAPAAWPGTANPFVDEAHADRVLPRRDGPDTAAKTTKEAQKTTSLDRFR